MTKTASKMRKASSVRNSSATMIAPFMFGSTTLNSRCQNVAPSTSAASSSELGTWASPASSSNDIKGVVFQISEMQMAMSADQWLPNQSWVSENAAKLRVCSQWLRKPVSTANANRQANADTTVMIA